MNPDTFTLENMFTMELHKHGNVIGDIVTAAVKELGIEKVWKFPTDPLPVSVSVYLVSYRSIFRTGCEGGGGHMGEHEVHCAALL